MNPDFINQAQALLGCKLVECKLSGLTSDSRQVQSGFCFLALSGARVHGSSFNDFVLAQGAGLILSDTQESEMHGQVSWLDSIHGKVACILVYGLNQHAGELADLFYSQPSMQLNLLGVTGTNGKTSVCEMIYQLSEALNYKAAYMGTLGVKYDEHVIETGFTTPDAIQVQQYLAKFVDAGCEVAAMEVSSHAVVQNRISGCQFDTLAFTNLSHDHLDYHQTMQAYFEAKASLFLNHIEARHVININTSYGQQLLDLIRANSQQASITAVGKNADEFSSTYVNLLAARKQLNGFELDVEVKTQTCNQAQQLTFELPLLAEFNIENALVALACLLEHKFSFEDLAAVFNQLKAVAGRMEVFNSVKNVSLVVDFAHTPDGLLKALTACKAHCSGQLWVVFGCGGDRDKQKRSQMGSLAAELADKIVLTNDNPRSEAPAQIIAEISTGIQNKDYLIEFDRKQAITLAYQQAQAGDCILIAGKGHETYQEFAEGKVEYNERAFVANLATEAA